MHRASLALSTGGMSPQPTLRIGTRGSPLALAQAEEVRDRLAAAHGLGPQAVEIVVISTAGDRIRVKPLRAFGGKGLFTKEIEAALAGGEVDLAVHSMKDVPTVLPDGLVIDCILPREDARDALLASGHATLASLPEGAVMATSSLRRRAQALRLRPDLRIVENRGNVQTRIARLASGEVSAMLLAEAGLRRLGLPAETGAPVAPEEILPAVAQGAIGIEIRDGDTATAALLVPLDDADSALRIATERAFLAALDGSCRTPIAGLAILEAGGQVYFRGEILTPDGRIRHATSGRGPAARGPALGREAGVELLERAGPDFFSDEA